MLTEDQKLARKNVLYALRNANETVERTNGTVYERQEHKMCFIGKAAMAVGFDLPGMAQTGQASTSVCINYVAQETGWGATELCNMVEQNDSNASWATIAEYLEDESV